MFGDLIAKSFFLSNDDVRFVHVKAIFSRFSFSPEDDYTVLPCSEMRHQFVCIILNAT